MTDQNQTTIEASLNYLHYEGDRPVSVMVSPGEGTTRRQDQYDQYVVTIADGRPLGPTLSLDREGVAFTRHDTRMTDFYDAAAVEKIYYPEMVALVKQVTGAARVVVFDHNVRSGDEQQRADKKVREPVRVVHNDYTIKSGPQRVRDLVPDAEADGWLDHRFAFINVWRPIAGPVESAPLAVCDAQSIAQADFIATDLKYENRTGEVYQATYSPDHRWLYFPRMTRDEAMLIKCYDSKDDGRARFTAHTAFDDPASGPDAAPRQSIEARTIAFFGPDG